MLFFFIRHTAGFFLQIYPCMLLCCLPFEEEDYRRGKRMTTAILTAGFAIASLLFGILMTSILPYAFRPPHIRATSIANLYMAGAVALSAVFYFASIRAERDKKLISLILAVDYAAFEYILTNGVLFLLENYFSVWTYEIYSPAGLLIFFLSTAATWPFMALFLSRVIREYFGSNREGALKKGLAVAVLVTFLYSMFLSSVIPAFESVYEMQTSALRLHFILDFLFATASVMLIYWYIFKEADHDLKQNDYRHQLEIQKLRYASIRSDIENTSRQRHDMRHHMRVLSRFLQEGKTEEAGAYLSRVTESYNSQELEKFCMEPIINALLQYYVGEARNRQISCSIRVSLEECWVEPTDMTVMLGNLLENAIHAAEQTEGERFLRLYMGIVNNTLALVLENSCPEPAKDFPVRPDGDFISGERLCRSNAAGTGIRSVAATVKRYAGSSEFRYQDGVFCCRMNMEKPQERSGRP